MSTITTNSRLAKPSRDLASLQAHFVSNGYPPPHPVALILPRPTGAEQGNLTESIRINGIRDPITVFDAMTLDGLSRCEAGIALGIPSEKIPKTPYDGDESSLLQFVLDKNLNRRHLDESQRAMIAATLATMRQGARTDLTQICGMSQPQAAKSFNVSVGSLQHADKVLQHGVPDLCDAVRDGLLPVSIASEFAVKFPAKQQLSMLATVLSQTRPAKALRAAMQNAESRARHNQIIANGRMHNLRKPRYPIMLVDSAWELRVSRKGPPYATLSVEQLCEFRLDDGRFVRDVAADDAIMFFWILDAYLFDVPKILEAWGGFTFCASMVWPKSPIGLGHYVRGQHELLLICKRGNFPPPETHLRPSSLIVCAPLNGDGLQVAPARDGRHSSKPERLYEIIEEAYPQYFGPETIERPLALELFARNSRPKWDGQGFEYPGPHQQRLHDENGEVLAAATPILLPKIRNAKPAGPPISSVRLENPKWVVT